MRTYARNGGVASGLLSGLVLGIACDEPSPPPAPSVRKVPSASESRTYEPPPPEGCVRAGPLEGLANDPNCVLARADEQMTREALKHLALRVDPEPDTTVRGGTLLLRVSIANVTSTEVLVPLEAHPPGEGPRPDWSRLSGVVEPRVNAAGDHFVFPVTTLDARERPVDGFQPPPWAKAAPRIVGARLRGGSRLTHVISWWALRIPAPLPPFRTDAGYRVVPKTMPIPLPKGDYVVRVELPLYGLSAAERSVTARVHVDPVKAPESREPPKDQDAGDGGR
jgi:hypothetical protein